MSVLKNLENTNIINITIGSSNANTFWGSSNWIDEKGNVKPAYMYNEKYLTGSKSDDDFTI